MKTCLKTILCDPSEQDIRFRNTKRGKGSTMFLLTSVLFMALVPLVLFAQQSLPFYHPAPAGNTLSLVDDLDYRVGPLAHDSNNNPFVPGNPGDYEVWTINETTGLWKKFSYKDELQTHFGSQLIEDGGGGPGTITIDNNDNIYILSSVRLMKPGDTQVKSYVVFLYGKNVRSSTFDGDFSLYDVIPDAAGLIRMETWDSHGSYSNYPPMIRYLINDASWPYTNAPSYASSARGNMYVIPTSRTPNNDITVHASVLIDDKVGHTGDQSMVTYGNKTYMTYLRHDSDPATDTNGNNAVYIKVMNRSTFFISNRVFLYENLPDFADLHSTPTIARDSGGKIHVMGGSHAGSGFNYTKSKVANPSFTKKARYVRIQKNDNTPLALAEVKILGDDGGGWANLATLSGTTATQSSTLTGYCSGTGAEKAKDGNTNGDCSGGSITHTQGGSGEKWWEIDLGASYDIQEIEIWNRTDCCDNRLSNYHVFMSENAFTSNTIAGIQAQSGVIDFHETSKPDPVTTISMIDAGDFETVEEVGSYRTYASLAIDNNDTMFDFFRGSGPGGYVMYLQTGTASGGWANGSNGSLFANMVCSGTYRNYYGSVTRDRKTGTGHSRVYANWTANCGADENNWDKYRILAHTDDGGATWYKTYRQDFLGNLISSAKSLQNIALSIPDRAYFNTDPITLSASSDYSGATFTYELVSGPATLSGNALTITGEMDTVIIKVSATGNSSYYHDVVLVKFDVVPDGSNVALNKTATQSSTSSQYGASASAAVNGNTDGTLSTTNVTHTAGGEQEPWWQVDLGASYRINQINVWNRTNCCGDRLSDYHIFIKDTPFTGSTISALQSETGVVDLHETTQPNPNTTIYTELKSLVGRYVRIQKNDGTALSLAEVEVFGYLEPSNHALNKTASQSSTYSGAWASLAVDGNTDGDYTNNSVSHTNNTGEKWWQVDMGSIYTDIDRIEVWNRTDCCGDRLSDYYVFVKDTPFTASTISGLQAESGVTTYHQTVQPNPLKIILTPGLSGRYVRVQVSGTNGALNLAEVKVLSITSGTSAKSLKTAVLPIEDLSEDTLISGISLHPNPVSDVLILTGELAKGTRGTIFSLLGHAVQSFEIDNDVHGMEVNVSTLSQGLYVLKITDSRNKDISIKFVKE